MYNTGVSLRRNKWSCRTLTWHLCKSEPFRYDQTPAYAVMQLVAETTKEKFPVPVISMDLVSLAQCFFISEAIVAH